MKLPSSVASALLKPIVVVPSGVSLNPNEASESSTAW